MRHTTELHRILRTATGPLAAMAGVSALINILYLTGSFFMLEVYDRVVPSRSIPTLVGLCVLALMLYGFQGALELMRSRVMGRLGLVFDNRLSRTVHALTVEAPLRGGAGAHSAAPIRDLDQIRTFLASSGPAALFDLPWLPVSNGDASITLVRGGCGLGEHRGPYGGCRLNRGPRGAIRRAISGAPRGCPPGMIRGPRGFCHR